MKRLIFITAVLFVVFWTVRAFAGTVQVSWNKNVEPDIYGYNILYGTASGQYDTTLSFTEGEVCTTDGCAYQIDGLTEGTTYYFVVQAVDLAGQTSEYSDEVVKTVQNSLAVSGVSVTQLFQELLPGAYDLLVKADGTYEVTSRGNGAPTVSVALSSSEIIEGGGVTVTATASDPEGDSLSYAWYLNGTLEESGSETFSPVGLSAGTYSIMCRVDDGMGNTVDSSTLSLTVLDGPHLTVPTSLTLSANYGDSSISGEISVSNGGNGNMAWSATTTSGILSLSEENGVNSGIVSVTADLSGLDPGDYYGDVIFTSDDADNSPQTVQVKITVAEAVSARTVPVGPNDWSWTISPTTESSRFSEGGSYGSRDNCYFEKVGTVFTVSNEERFLNLKLYFTEPSVIIIQLRNDNSPSPRWKRIMVSSFGDSYATYSSKTGWFQAWGSGTIANKEFLNISTGEVDLSIDLTTVGFNLGDPCNGMGFSVYTSDPKVIFGDISLSPNSIY